MKTAIKIAELVKLVVVALFWVAVIKFGCLVSKRCREVVAECDANDECPAVLDSVLDRLSAVHAELFGSDE